MAILTVMTGPTERAIGSADPCETPEESLARLQELSRDVLAAVLLGPGDRLRACTVNDPDRAADLGRLAAELFAAAADETGSRPRQIEVGTPLGAVFAIRLRGWTLAAVTRRLALPSLMFYDLRSVLPEPRRAAA